MKKVSNRRKRSKTMSEIKLVENISPVQEEVPLSHKLQDLAYE